MKLTQLTSLIFGLGAGLAACGDNGDNSADAPPPTPDATPTFATIDCTKVTTAHCQQIASGDAAALQLAANSISDDTTIILDAGVYKMTNSLTLRNDGVHLIGQGLEQTTIDFGDATAQGNGVDVIGDGFLVQDLTVRDSKKDGIRVEDSVGVVFRRIRATWTTAGSTSNGAYGIYPVKSSNVLVENSRAENASDAGLYVGQCQHVIVRNNVVTGNVAGLEIENTQYADVYGNTAENNTGGIVVFDLPGNLVVGRDIRVHDNMIRNNNHVNFGTPGTTVASIPVGTGTFAMASRRVEITNNTYLNNDTVDIAVISGLAIEPTLASWAIETSKIIGNLDGLNLQPADLTHVMNFRGENIVIAGNTHTGSGTKPDFNDPLHLGLLLRAGSTPAPVDSVVYDAIEEDFDSTNPLLNSNKHHICVAGNTGGTFGSLDLIEQSQTNQVPFFRPAAPFTPYDCTELIGGPVAEVVLP